MGEGVLDGIGELEGVDVPEAILNVRVNYELGQAKDFSTQVEGISKARFFSFLCRQGPR